MDDVFEMDDDKYRGLINDFYMRTYGMGDTTDFSPDKIILVEEMTDIGDNFVRVEFNLFTYKMATYVNDVLYEEVGYYTDPLLTEFLEELDFHELMDIDYKIFM